MIAKESRNCRAIIMYGAILTTEYATLRSRPKRAAQPIQCYQKTNFNP
jgi:hypothetical protein